MFRQIRISYSRVHTQNREYVLLSNQVANCWEFMMLICCTSTYESNYITNKSIMLRIWPIKFFPISKPNGWCYRKDFKEQEPSRKFMEVVNCIKQDCTAEHFSHVSWWTDKGGLLNSISEVQYYANMIVSLYSQGNARWRMITLVIRLISGNEGLPFANICIQTSIIISNAKGNEGLPTLQTPACIK